MSEAVKSELITHFLKTIWGGLPQDRFYVIAPYRTTFNQGVRRTIRYMERNIPLPDNTNIWHVYVVGSVYTDTFHIPRSDLPLPFSRWVTFEDTINRNGVVLDLYDQNGIQYPKQECFHMYTNRGVLLIAVKQNNRVPSDYTKEQVYIRHYKSTYVEQQSVLDEPKHQTKIPTQKNDITQFQDYYLSLLNKDRTVRCFVNGVMVDKFYINDINLYDVLEIEIENNIRERYDFNVSTLPAFTSDKDRLLKYLLSFDSNNITTNRYVDDVDIFIYHKDALGKQFGLYYHRNRFLNIRSVTHMSFSILSDMVNDYRVKLERLLGKPIPLEELWVELSIKNTLKTKPMVYDAHRMLDLHRLNSDQRIEFMAGIHNNTNYWNVSELENSITSRSMYFQQDNLTIDNVIDVLGYDSVSYQVSPSPLLLNDYQSYRSIDLKTLPSICSTIYEYTDGLLVDRFINEYDREYSTTDNHELIEVILGKGRSGIGSQYFTPNEVVTIDPSYSYRVYADIWENETPTHQWIDVTTDSRLTKEDTALIWSQSNTTLLLKQDKDHYYRKYHPELQDGTLILQLKEEYYKEGGVIDEVMTVPYVSFTVWLNGHMLVEDLDYSLIFPFININTKHYFNFENTTKEQIVEVRGVGLCDNTLTCIKPSDTGFVNNGLISGNQYFNIREQLNLTISIGGKLRHIDQVKFQETDTPINSVSLENGQPYSIKEIYTPVSIVSNKDTSTYRNNSLTIRNNIEAHLTDNIHTVVHPLNPIPQKYTLFSSFMANIIDLLVVDGLIITEDDVIDNQSIRKKIRHLEEWLKYDLPYINEYSEHYVQIHPHPYLFSITLSRLNYQFVTMVNNYYFNGKIKFTPLLKISNYG